LRRRWRFFEHCGQLVEFFKFFVRLDKFLVEFFVGLVLQFVVEFVVEFILQLVLRFLVVRRFGQPALWLDGDRQPRHRR
jgi:hypothetical protein